MQRAKRKAAVKRKKNGVQKTKEDKALIPQSEYPAMFEKFKESIVKHGGIKQDNGEFQFGLDTGNLALRDLGLDGDDYRNFLAYLKSVGIDLTPKHVSTSQAFRRKGSNPDAISVGLSHVANYVAIVAGKEIPIASDKPLSTLVNNYNAGIKQGTPWQPMSSIDPCHAYINTAQITMIFTEEQWKQNKAEAQKLKENQHAIQRKERDRTKALEDSKDNNRQGSGVVNDQEGSPGVSKDKECKE